MAEVKQRIVALLARRPLTLEQLGTWIDQERVFRTSLGLNDKSS
jgi:hypothetical protein